MAHYSKAENVEGAAGSLQCLIELTAAPGATEIDEAKMLQAIAAADEWINSYISERYAIPLETVPVQIREMSAEETVYRLRKRRNMHTERDREDHQERLDWLNDVARGRATLGGSTNPAQSGQTRVVTGDRTATTTTDTVITRDSLSGI